jgi:hypothetical protein
LPLEGRKPTLLRAFLASVPFNRRFPSSPDFLFPTPAELIKDAMKRWFPALLFTALLAPASHGRVGETLEECRARYGQETGKDDEKKLVHFLKSGLTVAATFENDRVAWLMIQNDRAGGAAWSAWAGLTDDQIDALQKANGGTSKWRIIGKPDPLTTIWRTDDKTRYALYSVSGGALIISNSEWWEKAKKQLEAERKKQVEGF